MLSLPLSNHERWRCPAPFLCRMLKAPALFPRIASNVPESPCVLGRDQRFSKARVCTPFSSENANWSILSAHAFRMLGCTLNFLNFIFQRRLFLPSRFPSGRHSCRLPSWRRLLERQALCDFFEANWFSDIAGTSLSFPVLTGSATNPFLGSEFRDSYLLTRVKSLYPWPDI